MRLWIVVVVCAVVQAVGWAQPELAPLPIAQELDLARLLIFVRQGTPAERLQAVTRLGQLRNRKTVPELIPLLADRDAGIRAATATAVGRICAWRPEQVDDRAVAPLRGLLADDVPQVRAAAATALGEIRSPTAAGDLASAIKIEQDDTARRAMAIALANLNDSRAYEPLRDMLKTADETVRRQIAWALTGKHDPQVIDAQIVMLADGDSRLRRIILEGYSHSRFPGIVPAVCATLKDPSPEVRRLAVECLRMQGDPQAVPVLLAALQDADPQVANQAGHALAEWSLQNTAIDGLLDALKSPKPSARAAALEGLYRSKDARVPDAVIPLMSDANAAVREAAARTLGGIEDPRALQPLVALLQSPDAQKRASAADALGELKRPEAVMPLLPLLKDTEAPVRYAVAGALYKIHDPSAVDALLAALTDKAEAVRIQVAQALGACRDIKAIPALLALLQTEKSELVLSSVIGAFMPLRDTRCVEPILAAYPRCKGQARIACFSTLATYPVAQVTEMVVDAMQSDDAFVREMAIQVAMEHQLYDPRMVPLLLQSLEKAEREGRANMAIWLLIGMKEQRAIAPLTALLQSKNRWLRSEAISGLGILGDKAIIPALEPLTHDPDPDIVLKAHGALLRLGRQESLEPLVTAAGDQNGMTSDAAMQMLAVSEHPHALVVLAGMLLDPQSPNRPQAAYWLMGRIAPAFLEALLAMANGTDPVERKLAALALAGNADPRTLAIQQRILRDGKTALPDNLAEYILPGLLQRVAIALAKQGDSDGMAYLVSAVGRYEQSYPSSQRTAARVLAEITGQDFGLDAAKWEAWWKEHRTARPADQPPDPGKAPN